MTQSKARRRGKRAPETVAEWQPEASTRGPLPQVLPHVGAMRSHFACERCGSVFDLTVDKLDWDGLWRWFAEHRDCGGGEGSC
jgi:hypothetical protein